MNEDNVKNDKNVMEDNKSALQAKSTKKYKKKSTSPIIELVEKRIEEEKEFVNGYRCLWNGAELGFMHPGDELIIVDDYGCENDTRFVKSMIDGTEMNVPISKLKRK